MPLISSRLHLAPSISSTSSSAQALVTAGQGQSGEGAAPHSGVPRARCRRTECACRLTRGHKREAGLQSEPGCASSSSSGGGMPGVRNLLHWCVPAGMMRVTCSAPTMAVR